MPNLVAPETVTTLGEQLRSAREAKGWSRERLAEKSGVSTTTIAEAELYGRNLRVSTLNALLEPLGFALSLASRRGPAR